MLIAETSLFGIWAGLVLLVAWVLLAFWPARVASRKGHSFLGYFFLSLLFFPLALIMAYVVADRHETGAPLANT
jgi:hypothetical protein